MLSIVYTLSEFCSLLLGTNLIIYTDYKSLAYNTLNNLRVLRWWLFLEEYNAQYVYVKGKNNNNYKSQQKGNIEDALFNSIFEDQELFECLQHIPL